MYVVVGIRCKCCALYDLEGVPKCCRSTTYMLLVHLTFIFTFRAVDPVLRLLVRLCVVKSYAYVDVVVGLALSMS